MAPKVSTRPGTRDTNSRRSLNDLTTISLTEIILVSAFSLSRTKTASPSASCVFRFRRLGTKPRSCLSANASAIFWALSVGNNIWPNVTESWYSIFCVQYGVSVL